LRISDDRWPELDG
jgi:fluoroquinolone resistance protein